MLQAHAKLSLVIETMAMSKFVNTMAEMRRYRARSVGPRNRFESAAMSSGSPKLEP
jgi:hypothetical protein